MNSISKYKDITFDMDEGYEIIIPKMEALLMNLDSVRANRIRESYSDIFKNIQFSSEENKNFLLNDLANAIDLALPDGWRFGQEEDYAAVYGFWMEDPADAFFEN